MDEFIFSFDIEKDCLTMTHNPEVKKRKNSIKKIFMAKKIKSKNNLQTGRKYLHHVGLISLLCKELLKNQRT